MKEMNNLKHWRELREKSQPDLARVLKAIGAKNPTKQKIRKIELGEQRMLPNEVIALASFLECEVGDLLPDIKKNAAYKQGGTKVVGGLADPPYKGETYHRASEGMGAIEEGAEILQHLLEQLRLAHPKAKKFVLSGVQQLIDEASLEEVPESGYATDSQKRPKKKK